MRRLQFGFKLLASLAMSLGLAASSPGQTTTQQQIDVLQQQLDQLRAESLLPVGGRPVIYQQPAKPELAGAPTVPNQSLLWSNASPGAESIAACPSEKKYPDARLTGFFHLDTVRFGQSSESRAVLGDIQDGTGFRRARLAAAGNVSERGSYMLEFDLAQGQPRFVDVWGQVDETPLGNLRIGRFRQPFGMAELSSARDLPLLERPTTGALAPFRQTGMMLSDSALDETFTWAVSGFRTLSDNFGNVYGDSTGLGAAERLTFLYRDRGDWDLIHFGVAHSYMDPARNQLQYASQPEIFAGQQPSLGPGGLGVLPIDFVPPFANAGVFNVDHANLVNLEAARSWGQTVVQAENRWSRVKLPTGDTTTVQAGYITLRHMWTGEVIPYNRSGGVFGRVKPDRPLDIAAGQWGAWETAARFSTLNLNPLFGAPGISGPTGRLDTATLGLNWYWWENAKSQFEWINADLTRPIVGTSISNTFAARLQFDF